MLPIQVVPLSEGLEVDWDRTVHSSPDGWLFSLTAWQRAILGVPRWRLRDHSFAVFDDGNLAAVMPLQYSGYTGRTTSSGWSGSGPVVASDLLGRDRERIFNFTIGEAKRIAMKNRSPIFDYWTSPITRSSLRIGWDESPITRHPYRDLSVQSQVIDLSSPEGELYADLHPDARRIIRRASEAGIQTRQVNWQWFLDAYYEAHCATYRRTGVEPHPKEYFAAIATHTAPLGHSVLFAAIHEGKPTAFINIARFQGGALYHTGCSFDEALKSGANYLLMWDAILWCKRHEVTLFDIGAIFPDSADEKQQGLTRFKTKFGGSSRRFFRCEIDINVPAPLKERAVTSVRKYGWRLRSLLN